MMHPIVTTADHQANDRGGPWRPQAGPMAVRRSRMSQQTTGDHAGRADHLVDGVRTGPGRRGVPAATRPITPTQVPSERGPHDSR